MADQDFIYQFHNIEGDLISQRKKNFFKLLKSNSASFNEEQLKNLQPKTYLESLFQVEIFIHLRQTLKLLDIFKGGNEIFISRVIKEGWFFKEAFKSITIEEFVNDFLPCTSFVIRLKVLKKLLIFLDETQIDTLFVEVHKRYGLHIAKRLLHGCTPRKIEEVLKDNEIKLEPSQVKKLFDKDPELFQKYLRRYKEVEGSDYYASNVLEYIALKNPKLWLEWRKTNRIQNCKLGRRVTKKVIANEEEDIVNNISEYLYFVNRAALVRKMRGRFPEAYLKIFPKENFEHTHPLMEFFSLLRHYPKNGRWNLFSQTYLKVYNKNLAEHMNDVNHWMLEIFPGKSIYRKWAEANYEATKSTSVLKYFLPERAIALIKEKINVTSDKSDRGGLVELLVECCAWNNDLKALEQVLKYICSRHRNEEARFHRACLQKIYLFNWEDLNENHWKYITEQLAAFKLRDKDWYNRFYHDTFCDKYLGFLLKNGKPYKEVLEEFIAYKGSSFRTNINKPELERQILLATIDLILKDTTVDEKTCTNRKRVLVNDIMGFSKLHPDHFVNIADFQSLLAYVNGLFDDESNEKLTSEVCSTISNYFLYTREFPQSGLSIDNFKLFNVLKKNDYYNIRKIFENLIKKLDRSEFENTVLNYFWDILDTARGHAGIITWYFYKEPRTLLPHFVKVLKSRLREAYPDQRGTKELFFKYYDVKLMTHLTFDVILTTTYLKELEDVDNLGDQSYCQELMSALCVVMSTEEFTDLVNQRLLPSKEKLDMEDKETLNLYNVQCAAAKAFKVSPEPVKVLPTIMKFCLGDYLQATLTSLYSAFYRSPEKSLHTYVDILSKRAVSVRKHALFLSCELLEYNFVVNMLKIVKQKNVSSQKHIFSSTLKYFLKNPSDDLLDLLISNLSTIDKNDEETLNSLAVASIPSKYKIRYIEKCWRFFESLEEQADVSPYIGKLFSVIQDTSNIIVDLSSDFCKHIIIKYYKDCEENSWNVESIVCKFLIQRETEQKENFRFVFEIISAFKDNGMMEKIRNFFDKFYKMNEIDETNTDDEPHYVVLFQQHWLNVIPTLVMFDEYLLLRLLQLKYQFKQPFFQNYAQHVTLLYEQLTSEYGPFVYRKFEHAVSKSIEYYAETDQYTFLLHLLKVKPSTANCILVLNLLGKSSPDCESWPIYNEILGILEKVEEPIVVIYYNHHKLGK